MTEPRIPPPSAYRLSLALCAALTVACGDPTDAPGPVGERTDSAGIQIVTHAGVADTLTAREDLRIGSMDDASEELLFYQIRDILVGDDGTLYVANDQTATVRVFGADGTFLHEFAGRGQGPSEIPAMLNDLMWAGDRLALIDWQRGGKTLVFESDGTFVDSWMNTQPDGERIMVAGYTPEGWIANRSDQIDQASTVPGQAYPRARWLQRLIPPDSLGEVVLELPPYVLYGSTTTHGLDWELFQPQSGEGFDGDGNYYRSNGVDYRIDVWNPSGQPIRSIRRRVETTPITEAHIEALRGMVRRQYDTMSVYADNPARRQEALDRVLARVDEQATFPRPSHAPPLGRLLVSRDGAVWAERPDVRDPAEEWHARRHGGGFGGVPTVPTQWDVFTPDGEFRGTVTLPALFRPFAVTADAVVGVEKDEFDVEYVVRYRVGVDRRSPDPESP